MLRKIFSLPIFLIFFLILFISPAIASNVLFQDDFSGDIVGSPANNWEVVKGNPSYWKIEEYAGRKYYVDTIPKEFPQTSSMTAIKGNESFNWTNYIIESELTATAGVDQLVIFRLSNDYKTYYEVDLRYEGCPDCNNIRIVKRLNGVYSKLGELKPIDLGYSLKWNTTYYLKITINNDKLEVFINGKKIFDYTDNSNPILSGKVGFWGWNGSWAFGAKYFYKNLIVTEIPKEYLPILLLPGLGSSWNLGGLFADATAGPWTKTPFVNTYDNLKATLITNAGYQEGVNYFEYYYDWRKPLPVLADEFKQYLDTNPNLQNLKVNLVGHSMGGLLARTYAQKYGLEKINQIVTVGSPHEGVVQAYNAWGGGIIDDKINWGSLALKLLLNSKRFSFQTTADAVKTLAPSMQNLLPIFDYLKVNATNQVISVNNLIEKNNLLGELKNSINQDQKNIMSTIYGKENNPNEDTLEWLKVQSPNWLDQILGLWPDGKPVAKEYSSLGDLTVLKKSATISGIFAVPEVVGNHNDIISSEAGVQAVLNQLGMAHITPITNTSNIIRPAILFFMHSPANILVTAPDGKQAGYNATNQYPNAIYSPENKLILLPQTADGDYTVKLYGTGTDSFDLDVAQLGTTKDVFYTITNKISKNDEQTYTITFNATNPLPNPLKDNSGLTFLQMARQKLVNLDSFIGANVSNYPTQKRIRYNLQQSIKNADSAINNVKNNNYLNASKIILSLITDNFLWRRYHNDYYKNGQLEFTSLTFANNGLREINENLAQPWLISYNLAGKTISSSTSQSYRTAAQQLVSANEAKIKSSALIINKPLGNAFTLTNDYLQQANTFYNSKSYEACYIYALMSRNLSTEVSGLLK